MSAEWHNILDDISRDSKLKDALKHIRLPSLEDVSKNRKPLKIRVTDPQKLDNVRELLSQKLEIRLSSLAGRPVKVRFETGEQSVTTDRISKNFTFANFITGQSNRLAASAAKTIIQFPGKTSPLYVFGKEGCGKTHLVQAIANELIRQNPQSTIVYFTMDTFRHYYRQMAETMSVEKKQLYKSGDVLIIEDFHANGKTSAGMLEELYFLFNEYYELQKQIIITSESDPDSNTIPARWLSRIKSGVSVEMQYPDQMICMETLKRKFDDYDIKISREELVQYTETIKGQSFRSIESLVNNIYFNKLNNPDPVTIKPRPEADFIISCVATEFRLKSEDLLSSSRKSELTLPRHIAMHLVLELTGLNKSAVARAFNRSDHSTVIHADKKIRSLIDRDGETAEIVNRIRNHLTGDK